MRKNTLGCHIKCDHLFQRDVYEIIAILWHISNESFINVLIAQENIPEKYYLSNHISEHYFN